MLHWIDSFDDCEARNFFYRYINMIGDGHVNEVFVSVIIPCYNQGKYLREAIFSVLLQEYSNFEILIINDGSDDDTEKIALALAKSFPQIKYFSKANAGLGHTRNLGLANASGTFIQFLDSDDTMSRDKLLSQVLSIVYTQNVDVLYSPYICFEDGNPSNQWTYSRVKLKGDPAIDLIMNWEKDLSIPIHCFLFKKQLIDSIRFDEELPNHEDWLFHLCVASKKPRYSFIDSGLALYRVRNNSMARNQELMIKGKRMCLEKAIDSLGFDDLYITEIRNRLMED